MIVLKSLFEIHLTALVKFWFPIDYDLRTFTIDHHHHDRHHQAVEVAATNARGLVEESLQESSSSSLSLILPLILKIILSSKSS